jgi:hypothetical protein
MYSHVITVLWCEMATHGGLALFQNENDLSPESDLTIVDKKKSAGVASSVPFVSYYQHSILFLFSEKL